MSKKSSHDKKMEQLVTQMIKQMEQATNAIQSLQKDIDADRFADLSAGKKVLLRAFEETDEAIRNMSIVNAQSMLTKAGDACYRILKIRTNDFEEIPHNPIRRFFIEAKNPGYSEKKDREVDEIEVYSKAYIESIVLTSGSYYMQGNEEQAKKILEEGKEALEKIDFSKVKTVEFNHRKKDYSYMLYNGNNAVHKLETIGAALENHVVRIGAECSEKGEE